MTFLRSPSKTSGDRWQLFERLKSTQINYIEDNLVHALDGYGGGSYSLNNPLSVLGDLVTFDDLTVNDRLDVLDGYIVNAHLGLTTITGNVTHASGSFNELRTSGDALITDDCIVGGDLTVGYPSGSTTTLVGTTSIVGALSVTGAVVTGNATVGGTLGVTGGAVITGGLAIYGNLTAVSAASFNDTLSFSSTGRIVPKGVIGPDADHTFTVFDAQHITALITTARNYRLSSTGVVEGDTIRVVNATSHNLVVIDDATSTALETIKTASTYRQSGIFVYSVAGGWANIYEGIIP